MAAEMIFVQAPTEQAENVSTQAKNSCETNEEQIERHRQAQNLLDAAASAISILLASLGVSLLSYARSTFSDRAARGIAHNASDDATTALWFLSVFFAVICAVLGRRGVTETWADIIRTASFVALLAGAFVFVWAELTRAVAISFTVAISVALIGFLVKAVWTRDLSS